MPDLCLMWASKCYYCWQLLLKTTGVRALFSESSNFGGFQASLREASHLWMSQMNAAWAVMTFTWARGCFMAFLISLAVL